MPDLLPQLGPQPAPPPTRTAPSNASKPVVSQRDDPDRDEAPESFSDTYESLEKDEAPAQPPTQEADADSPAPRDAAQSTVVVAASAPTGAFLVAETDEGQPRLTTAGLSTTVVPKADGEALLKPAASPAQVVVDVEATPQVPTRGKEIVQISPVAAEPEIDPQVLRTVNRAATPVPADVVPDAKTLPQRPATQTTGLTNITPVEVETQVLPDGEIEAPLPERIGPRAAADPTVQIPQQAANLMQQVSNLVATGADDGLSPIADIAPTGPQGPNAAQVVSPTAPGTAPTQIVQHAAAQIVTALPRDQGVFLTNAGAEIALDPPELGRVRMIVTEVAGGLALTVTAERPETLDLFRRHASMLAGEFAREGFSDTNFEFEGERDDGEGTGDSEGRPALRIAADPQDLINGVTPQLAQGGLDLRL